MTQQHALALFLPSHQAPRLEAPNLAGLLLSLPPQSEAADMAGLLLSLPSQLEASAMAGLLLKRLPQQEVLDLVKQLLNWTWIPAVIHSSSAMQSPAPT